MFENIKKYLICFILGFLCGGICVFAALCNAPECTIPPGVVKTTTLSGEKQVVSNVKSSRGTLSWTNTATGAGVSTTSIPLTVIPEANNWLTKRHMIIAKAYELWTPDGLYPGGGVDYYYRYGRLICGGGVIIAQKYAGVSAGLGIVF